MESRVRTRERDLTIRNSIISSTKRNIVRDQSGDVYSDITTVQHITIPVKGRYKKMLDTVGSGFKPGTQWAFNPCNNRDIVIEDLAVSGSATYSYKPSADAYAWTDRWEFTGLPALPEGLIDSLYEPSSGVSTNISGEAITDALAKRYHSGIGAVESLAEVRQTLSMMRKIPPLLDSIFENVGWARIMQLMKYYGRHGRDKKLRDDLTAAWLQWRYGVRPLVIQVETILRGLRARQEVLPRTVRGKADRSDQQINESETSLVWSSAVNRTIRKFRVAAHCTIVDKYALSKREAFGYHLSDILLLPWALTSYSFVVDWFVNIGAYLSGYASFLRTPPDSVCLGACISVKTVTNIDVSITAKGDWPGVPTQWVILVCNNNLNLHQSAEYTAYNRSPLPVNVLPELVIKADKGFSTELSSLGRYFDALSLVWQRLKL